MLVLALQFSKGGVGRPDAPEGGAARACGLGSHAPFRRAAAPSKRNSDVRRARDSVVPPRRSGRGRGTGTPSSQAST
jgi:hypothetical protein